MTDDTTLTRRKILGVLALIVAKSSLKIGVLLARQADHAVRLADDAARAIPPPGARDDAARLVQPWPDDAEEGRTLKAVLDGMSDMPFDALGGSEDED
ncbi:hypothetical protein HKCCSP123_02815 [Rhodobacterales bacterium HKCCSP123]|nr:hypothetical protein [Rhodobacterales bacterium HKCCSP123]